jgi:molybdopterin-binding protein
MMELLHLSDAARELAISYPTLKQWIYRGKINSVTTAGGHHRIPRAEIDRLLFHRGTERSTRFRSMSQAEERTRPVATAGARRSPGLAGSDKHGGSVKRGTMLEHRISGRNQLVGRVTEVETVGLLSKVSLDVGGQTVTAIITRDACRDLRLKVGDTAAALIKATEVMIIRAVSADDDSAT